MKGNNLANKLAFASCDIFGGGSFNIINFLYPGFLALTVGLSPYWISIIVLVARLWDAISDPLMGRISDATSSRFGKRRIYLVVASPLVLVSFVLMFFPYSFSSTTMRVLCALGSYLLFYTVQTMVMIPYISLSSEIAGDYKARASYNGWRLGFSIFSSILCVAVPGMIVDSFSGNRGYIVMGLVFGTAFAIAVLITGLLAREEIVTPPVKHKDGIMSFGKLLMLKPFRQYLIMFLMLGSTMTIMSALYFFYIDFYVFRELTASGQTNTARLISAALMFSMQIVALPFYTKMIGDKGKPYAYRFGAVIWIICAVLLLFIRPGTAALNIYILAALMGFGISGPGLVPHTMFGDVADFACLVFGERKDGLIGGCVNFLNKTLQALVIAIVMAVIGMFGFIEAEPGNVVLSQPESAQMAIRAIMVLAPLLLLSVGILVSTKYKVDYKTQQEIADVLKSGNRERSRAIIDRLQKGAAEEGVAAS